MKVIYHYLFKCNILYILGNVLFTGMSGDVFVVADVVKNQWCILGWVEDSNWELA